jgi:hypothetical protein
MEPKNVEGFSKNDLIWRSAFAARGRPRPPGAAGSEALIEL